VGYLRLKSPGGGSGVTFLTCFTKTRSFTWRNKTSPDACESNNAMLVSRQTDKDIPLALFIYTKYVVKTLEVRILSS
jgi:hypothetical protein